MTVRVVAAGVALALSAAACGGTDDTVATTTTAASTTTASASAIPEPPASTTTTMFDPTTVEGQVEAAYLKSWDVYAHAVYHLELDEQAFAEVYAGDHLQTKTEELTRRIANDEAALVEIEHDYAITLTDSSTAQLVDKYRNHQVLIDPSTKAPIEEDPDDVILRIITLRLTGGVWRVSLVQDLE